jgi:uncharacterized protein
MRSAAGARARSISGGARINEPQQALLSYVLMGLAVTGFTLVTFWAGVMVARGLGREVSFALSPLGFARPRGGVLAGVSVGLLVGAGAVLASMFINVATISVFDRLGLPTERTVQTPYMQGLADWVRESPQLAIPAIVLVVVIFGPAFEEFVFRGILFNGLYRLGLQVSASDKGKVRSTVRRVSFPLAALLSSALFALVHLEPVLLPVITILAIALCFLFERTGSLLPPFVAHATFNSFAVTLIILGGLGVFEMPM